LNQGPMFHCCGSLVFSRGSFVWWMERAPSGKNSGFSLIVLAIAVYAFNLGVTYVRGGLWTPVNVGASLSLLDLCVTVVLGTTLGVAAWTGWSPTRYELNYAIILFFQAGVWLGAGDGGQVTACFPTPDCCASSSPSAGALGLSDGGWTAHVRESFRRFRCCGVGNLHHACGCRALFCGCGKGISVLTGGRIQKRFSASLSKIMISERCMSSMRCFFS
jgi:hypothetical protein